MVQANNNLKQIVPCRNVAFGIVCRAKNDCFTLQHYQFQPDSAFVWIHSVHISRTSWFALHIRPTHACTSIAAGGGLCAQGSLDVDFQKVNSLSGIHQDLLSSSSCSFCTHPLAVLIYSVILRPKPSCSVYRKCCEACCTQNVDQPFIFFRTSQYRQVPQLRGHHIHELWSFYSPCIFCCSKVNCIQLGQCGFQGVDHQQPLVTQ